MIYPDLVGKKLGLLLQKVLDSYNGKDSEKMELFGVFEAGTGFTATEILDKAPHPEMNEVRYIQLMQKPVKDKRGNDNFAPQSASYAPSASYHGANSSTEMSDEIPF